MTVQKMTAQWKNKQNSTKKGGETMKKLFMAMSLCAALILSASPFVHAHDLDVVNPDTGSLMQNFPHYDFCGFAHPQWIELRDSHPLTDVPNDDCVTWINFDLPELDSEGHPVCRDPLGAIIECNGENFEESLSKLNEWAIYAEAFGTQINLSLLKAVNFEEYISLCFAIYFDKDGYHARIWRVDFGWDPPAPGAPGN